MHVYHRLAVVADNEEEAKNTAVHFAEEQGWSDWCCILEEDRINEEECKIATNFKDNPEIFNKLIKQACEWTQATVNLAVELYGDVPLKDLLTNPKYDFKSFKGSLQELTQAERETYLNESLAIYKVTRALRILNDEYDSDTMFYDTVEYTPNPKWVDERSKTDPDKQWIVIVDYHF